MSSSMTLPKPWQTGQAPNGLLNENSRGCGTSYGMLQVAALEALAEAVDHRRRGSQRDRERRAAAFGVGRLDRVGQARAEVAIHLQPIDDDLQRRPIAQGRRVDILQRSRPGRRRRAGRSPCAAAPRASRRSSRPARAGPAAAARALASVALADAFVIVGPSRGQRHRKPGRPACRSRSAAAFRPAACRATPATTSAVSRTTSLPHERQMVRPTRA